MCFQCAGKAFFNWQIQTNNTEESSAESPLPQSAQFSHTYPTAYSIYPSTSLIFPPASQSGLLRGWMCESAMGEIILDCLFGFSGPIDESTDWKAMWGWGKTSNPFLWFKKKKKRGLLPFLPNATIFDPSTQIIHRLVFIQVAQFRFINSSLNSIGIRFFWA